MSTNETIKSTQKSDNPTSGYIRCKVCGYVTKDGVLKDLCPACGVKSSMFEPVTEKFSVKRRQFLDLHIHPIIVHFPQAFAITILLTEIGSVIFKGVFQQILFNTTELLSYVMPLVLLLSFASGIKDGQVRFRKLGTPFLKLKIRFGIIYFVVSIVNAVSAYYYLHGKPVFLFPLIICAVAMSLFTTVLGKIGAELSCSKMPG